MSNLPIIAITMGDPSGVGPEIIGKALQNAELYERCTPLVVGDKTAMERALALYNASNKIIEVKDPEDSRFTPVGDISLLATSQLSEKEIEYGNPSVKAGDAVYRYICKGAELCQTGAAAAMVTAPITKAAMHKAGHDYPGHTELLAKLCNTEDFVMMLAGNILRVSLVTIHEAIANVPALITYQQVLKTIQITAEGVWQLTGKNKPKLAVLALNPHAGEGGMFGREDMEIIAPAVEAARKLGIDAVGPLSADTLFYFAQKGIYDGVVAMYHDQGLIPLKMLHFDDGVNITLGLPIIRTSVDHGSAYNLAGKGVASEKSLLAAIKMAVDMVFTRSHHQL